MIPRRKYRLGSPPFQHQDRAKRDYEAFERDARAAADLSLDGDCRKALSIYGRARGYLGRFRSEAEGASWDHQTRLRRALRMAQAAEGMVCHCLTSGKCLR